MKSNREFCIRDHAVTAAMLAMSLFVVEGLAMLSRFEEMPKDLAFRLMGCHMVLLILFFTAGMTIQVLLKLPGTLSSIQLPALMILLSGEGDLQLVPVISGIAVLGLITIYASKRNQYPSQCGMSASFLMMAVASVLAKGSLLQNNGWLNFLLAALWLIIAMRLLKLHSRISMQKFLIRSDRATLMIGSIAVIIILGWGFIYSESLPVFPERGSEDVPNIVLIIVDTVRPEGLLGFDGGEPAMPNLRGYGDDHIMIPAMIAPAPSSLPSHATLFTGLPSSIHGAHKPSLDDPDPPFYAYSLDDDVVTLAERLSARGYRTAAISGNYGPLSPRFGLSQGFDYYDAERNMAYRSVEKTLFRRCVPLRRACESLTFPVFGYQSSTPYRNAKQITDKTLLILEQFSSRQPFFLFINLFDVHSPYLPPEYWKLRREMPGSEWIHDGEPSTLHRRALLMRETELSEQELSFLKELFEREMSFVDFHLRRILEALDEQNTLVIIVSDHGESLSEHGLLKHSNTLFREEIEVPCVVALPRNGSVVQDRENLTGFIGLHDLMLRTAGLSPPVRVAAPGRISEAFNAQHPMDSGNVRSLFTGDLKCLHQHPWKLIWKSDGRHQLFNMLDDGEYRELSDMNPEIVTDMSGQLEAYFRSFSALPEQTGLHDFTNGELEALKTLGYIQ